MPSGVQPEQQAPISSESAPSLQAVVGQLNGERRACLGSLVAKSGRFGWVLTAAHCTVRAHEFVVQRAGGDATFQVVGVVRHSEVDLALVRILGVVPSTPVMEITTEPIEAGAELIYLTRWGTPHENLVSLQVAEVRQNVVSHLQSPSGPCAGDSGGPGMTQRHGRFIAHSVLVHGDANCAQYAESLTIDEEIRAALDAQRAAPPPTCRDCWMAARTGDGECTPLSAACVKSSPCELGFSCLERCQSTACAGACIGGAAFEAGAGTLYACLCAACSGACSQRCGR